MTVAKWADKWFETYKSGKEHNTKEMYRSAQNELMTETAFRRFWQKIMRELNLAAGGTNGRIQCLKISQDITTHMFRHTYATSLYYAGVDVKTAQYLLGHASIEMTMNIYTHLSIDKNFNAASQLDAFYGNQSKISQNENK